MKIKITADSTCDLSKELIEKYQDIYDDILLMSELSDILTEKRRKRGYIINNEENSRYRR